MTKNYTKGIFPPGADLPAHVKRLIDWLDRLLAEQKAKEERKRKEAEAKQKAKEDRKRKEAEAKRKEKHRSDVAEEKPYISRKKRRKFLYVAVPLVLSVLIILAIFIYIKIEAEQARRTRNELQRSLINGIGMKFVEIPAGSYTMGSSPGIGYDNERPSHSVTISRSFYLQKTEVTQGQWKKVMGDNPSDFKECGSDCPVEQVSWEDAHEFIKKLNEMEEGEAYRMPTEAEWEYAARAGTTTLFSFGDDKEKLTDYAWFRSNSDSKTHRVAAKKPNPWGLYDMHGNVWEWVEDDWHKDYNGAPDDGHAWIDKPRGAYRVFRGGSWVSNARRCRSAFRFNGGGPGRRNVRVGFRLARSDSLGP